MKNTNLKKKYIILEYFSIIKILKLNFQLKHIPYITHFMFFLKSIIISIPYLIDLLRSENMFL